MSTTTTSKSKTGTTAGSGSRSARKDSRMSARATDKPQDAIRLLKADHREVEDMFKKYEKLDDGDDKLELARAICKALTVHTQIEEEIFYPAARESIEDDDLMNEAQVEHASAKQLIAELMDADATDDMFDAKVKVLGEYVHHHVTEEEKEMFPECRDAKIDLVALGETMRARKDELMASSH